MKLPKLDQRSRNIFKRLMVNFVVHDRGRWNTLNSIICNHLSTSQANSWNYNESPAIFGLCRHPRASRSHIPQEWHDPIYPQQCLVPQETKCQETCRGTPLSLQKCDFPPQQWCHSQCCWDYQSCNVLSCWSKTWIVIYQCKKRSKDKKYLRRNGTSPTPHPSANRQFNSRRDH